MSNGRIDYWSATWCQPCKVLKPRVVALCKANDWEFVEYDVDVETSGALGMGILGVPTIQITPAFGGFATVLTSDMASILRIKKAMGL